MRQPWPSASCPTMSTKAIYPNPGQISVCLIIFTKASARQPCPNAGIFTIPTLAWPNATSRSSSSSKRFPFTRLLDRQMQFAPYFPRNPFAPALAKSRSPVCPIVSTDKNIFSGPGQVLFAPLCAAHKCMPRRAPSCGGCRLPVPACKAVTLAGLEPAIPSSEDWCLIH